MDEKKSCMFAGFEHPHDSKVCQNAKCMRCKDGKWEDIGKGCPC